MARPSSDLDLKMIEAGCKIIEVQGMEGLTIRNICSLASVNTGLFNYYFSTKENFLVKLLDHTYNEFLNLNSDDVLNSNIDSLEKLKVCLERMLEFVVNKEKFITSILYDALLNSRELFKKVSSCIINKHILIKLIEECTNQKYFSTSLPAIEIFAMFILGGFGFQHSALANGYDVEHKEDRAKLRKERVSIILNGLLSKGDN